MAGAAVVALRGDAVLLVRRGREPNRGRWSLPGGSIEPGETARAAAAREAMEETGLRLRIGPVVEVYDAIFPASPDGRGYHYCVADFLAEPEAPEAEPVPGDDATDACWAPVAELHRYEVTDAVRSVVSCALALRSQPGFPSVGDRSLLKGSLYVITRDRGEGRGHVDVAAAALRGGARVIQLRDKRMTGSELADTGRRIARLCGEHGALFVMNDRADAAFAAGAAGLHLGQEDLSVEDARRLLGPAALIGVSVEDERQARDAGAAGADYLGVGDIYGTKSKSDSGLPVGLDHLRRLRAVTTLPIVAIGGITADRVEETIQAGADSVAVISAVASAPDMEAAARELAELTSAAFERQHP